MNMERYKRLRDLREDHDMTQKAVGEAINVPQRTYAYYESAQISEFARFFDDVKTY